MGGAGQNFFQENQRFAGTWIMFLFGAISLFPLTLGGATLYKEGVFSELMNGVVTLANMGQVLALLSVPILLTLMIFYLEMQTWVESDGIHYSYFPFVRERVIKWEDIEELNFVTYDPLSDCGGWGIKSWKGGMAYNVMGDKGLEVIRKGKKPMLLGTQQMADFHHAIFKAGFGYLVKSY